MKSNGPDPMPGKAELAPTRATLIAKVKDPDDERSWREFHAIYHPLILGRVINRGLPEQDAEAITQEVFAGVARRLPEFIYRPEECSFKTWLFRIAQYRVADHFRRRAREGPPAEAGTDAMARLEEMPDPATVEPDAQWNEAYQESLAQVAFKRARQRANPRYMQIYLYSEIEGHSVAETARHLQTTENDVSVARHRIKELLRDEGERLLREEKRREEQAGTAVLDEA